MNIERRRRFWGVSRRVQLGMGVLVALWAAVGPRVGGAQTDTAPASPETTAQPIKLPDTLEGLKTLRDEWAAELARLQPATQPAGSQPASQPTEPEPAWKTALDLYSALQTLIVQIDQQMSARNQIGDLKSPERIESFAKELAALQQETKELEAKLADPPPYASDDDLQKAADQYEEQNQELNRRTALQTERTKALADAPQRRQQVAAAVQKAYTAFEEQRGSLRGQLDAAKTAEERSRAAQQARRAQLDASLPLFQEACGKLLDERDTIVQNREERRIPILQALVAALADWKALLQQTHARSERERIEAQLQFAERHPQTTAPYSITYWKLSEIELVAREDLEKREQGIRTRFTQAAAAGLEQTLTNERAVWVLFMESLERRPSDQIQERYRKVEAALAEWQHKLAVKRRLLDESADNQQDIVARIDAVDDQIRPLERTLNDQLNAYLREHPEDTRVQRYNPEYSQFKTKYVEQAQAARTEATELTARLQDATTSVAAFVTDLQQYRSRLYWRYLFVPERPLWTYRPATLQADWTAEQAQRTQTREALRDTARGISPVQWVGLLVTLACVEALAIAVRRRARRYTHAVVKRFEEIKSIQEDERAPIADRLHLLVARLVGRTAPLAWPAAAAAIFVPAYGVVNLPATAILSALAFLLAVVLSEALIRVLFLPGKSRQRLLRCSNVVAAHYRRWALALWVATVLLVPVPLLLRALDWSYSARVGLWNGFRIVALLLVLAFGLRRQLVLRVAGRPEQVRHPWVFGLISAAYWLLWAGLLGLLALEIAGYGALVTYAIAGVVETVATITLAQLVARYVSDLTLRLQEPPAERQPQLPEPAPAPEAAAGAAEGRNLGLGLAVGVFRWCVAAAALLLVLYFWGLTAIELEAALAYPVVAADAAAGRPAITVARVLAAILSVVAAWWVSRGLRAFLVARVYPAYAGIDRGARAAINTVLHYFLVLLGLYFALFALRVPLGALTVVLGTLGLGIGLGLQPLFVNFISGLMILFERHVRIGDLIAVHGELGEVTGVNMRSTTIKTGDGVELVIPNSDLITQNVANWTLRDTQLRGHVPVSVAYGTDVELVRRLLADILKQHPLVLPYPPPEVWFMAFGANSLDFEIAAWFQNAANRGRFTTSVRFEIARVFRAHGVEIPFPQRTLSVAGGGALPVRLVPQADSPAAGAAPRAAEAAEQPRPPRAPGG